jgi:hypothetical protein
VTREPWARETAKEGGRGGLLVIGLLVVVALIGGGIYAFKVATSDIKGRGDTTIRTNSADNRIFAQEDFHKRYQDIVAADQKLDPLAADVKADPSDKDARIRLTGAKTYCLAVAGEYNAKADAITQAKFRDENLPYHIDPADPATDCKESAR